MKPVDPVRYRPYVASLDLPIEQLDVLIDIVHAILAHFVDQAFYVQTDQITLQSAGKSFPVSPSHATIEHDPQNKTANVQGNGVERDSNPVGPTEP